MVAIQAAGSIAPPGPGVMEVMGVMGVMPGNMPGGLSGAWPPPGAKAAIHLPIICVNSGSAAVGHLVAPEILKPPRQILKIGGGVLAAVLAVAHGRRV